MNRTITTLRRQAKRWRRRRTARAVVLLYHRVAEPASDPQMLAVSPGNFEAHLQVLQRRATPVSLGDLGRAVEAGRVPDGSVAVTFDDGYADNARSAGPILARQGVPATFYVASGFVGTPHVCYWDALDLMLLRPGKLPARLELTVDGQPRAWALGRAAVYTDEDFQEQRHWNVLRAAVVGSRQHLYQDLCELLRRLPAEEQTDILNQVFAQVVLDEAPAGEAYRPMNHDELRQLAESPGAAIGAHSVSHVELAHLPIDEQARQIKQSKADLESIIGRRVESFSYPYGSRDSYTAATVEAVRSNWYETACSNFPGPVRRGSNLLELPRHLVRNWDSRTFERHLEDWLNG
jgi:peptidoglycan/xylan/chitin deacetylase (PgdA/CDA1 family)